MRQRKQSGFTLLEMMIAIALFSLLSMAAYQVLQGVLRNGEVSRSKAGQLDELHSLFNMMEKDFSQAIIHPAFTATYQGESEFYSELSASDADNDSVKMIRTNWFNLNGLLARSQIEQVEYRLQGGVVERVSYGYPLAVNKPTVTATPLLSNVEHLQLRFYKYGRWQEGWLMAGELPDGVEVTVKVQGYGLLQRLFLLTPGDRL